ncbi:MAG: xanthine dehydrogenase family protein, partial [Proteobacteria bacterium]|nr:xanthine dehydrogenase family protein [Burkholderiales bacterium]
MSAPASTPMSAPGAIDPTLAPAHADHATSLRDGARHNGDADPRRKFVGQRVTRLEDPPLVTGRGTYVGNLNFPHQLHMRVARSVYAHAQIRAIDTSAARAHPGCVAVWTGEDVADIPPITFRATSVTGLEPYRQFILARDRVRYVGEPIAVVFAEDPYLAEDIAELITMEADELPLTLSADAPPGEFAPGRSTEAAVLRKNFGDVDAAFRVAHTVVEVDIRVGRHSGVPLENRGALARVDHSRDVLELYGACKRPHAHRDAVAALIGRSPASMHFYEGHVGGGFGVRGEIYPEDVLVCLAAVRLDRPVKWIEDRRENLLACNHSREQHHVVRAALDADARLLAIDAKLWHDQGAYVRTHGARVPDMAAGTLLGGYDVPAYRSVAYFRITNKTPAATYRSPGRFESTYACERLMDAVAEKFGLSRIEVRRRNLIRRDQYPYPRAMDILDHPVELDSGDFERLLDRTLDHLDYDRLQSEVAQRRARGELVGIGMGFFMEKGGLGPVDGVRVSVDTKGIVQVVTGSSSIGQGVETVMAQICADALGVEYRNVRVIHGRTDMIEYGIGAHASRATVMTGGATRAAALNVRRKALEFAAQQMIEAPLALLDIVDGAVVRTDRPGEAGIPIGRVAAALGPSPATVAFGTPGLTAEGWFETAGMTHPYGIHTAVVKVDPETGQTRVERFHVAYDIGCAINPMLVEGQIVGGVAQGLGGALFEEFVYDARGEPLSVTFADYLMPTA